MVLVSGFDELKYIHSSEFAEDRGDMIQRMRCIFRYF